MNQDELKIPSITAIKNLLEPIYERLDKIESKIIHSNNTDKQRYYRNEDLKKIFGLSNNTIIKYRETGILPYTKLGDIYLYEAPKIEQLLRNNSVEL
ncbi:helix-turn-helix domain-containing protein [Flavobacterium beibuense]|uniref:helix-turn-helix domain-containing protein n=1 Tax=Flavobacterium beibuense TaxID=657326 RepID=UPI003A92CFD7